MTTTRGMKKACNNSTELKGSSKRKIVKQVDKKKKMLKKLKKKKK